MLVNCRNFVLNIFLFYFYVLKIHNKYNINSQFRMSFAFTELSQLSTSSFVILFVNTTINIATSVASYF